MSPVPFWTPELIFRTRLLQPSLSGDALISVICTVSPSALNVAESLSTLSFAQGLKRVTLKAQKKEMIDPQALIQQYQNEIAELKALLREKEVIGVENPAASRGDVGCLGIFRLELGTNDIAGKERSHGKTIERAEEFDPHIRQRWGTTEQT